MPKKFWEKFDKSVFGRMIGYMNDNDVFIYAPTK